MDELIKELQKKYIEDFTGSLSFHKLLVFATFLICLLKLIQKNYSSIWIELLNSRVKDIFDSANGPFSKVTVLYIFISITLTVLSASIHECLKIKLFNFFASKVKFDAYVDKIIERSNSEITENQSLNLYLADEQSKQIAMRRKNLSKIHNFSEILFAFFVVSISASVFRTSYLDLFFGVIFFFIALYLQRKSFEYYTSRIVPFLVVESLLRDKKFKFIDGFQEKT
jgi:hypothetical protein